MKRGANFEPIIEDALAAAQLLDRLGHAGEAAVVRRLCQQNRTLRSTMKSGQVEIARLRFIAGPQRTGARA